jgi:hypothetical protein
MKRNDSIEEFILNHRDDFDELTPAPQSWDAIADRLDAGKKRPRLSVNAVLFRKMAAAVVVMFALYGAYNVAIRFDRYNKTAHTNNSGMQNPMLSELAETEAFYVSRVENKMAELERLCKDHPQALAEIEEEFKLLDSDLTELKTDLQSGVSRQEIVEAMVENYRIKLRIVENILEQMNQNENQNHAKDEIQSIEM